MNTQQQQQAYLNGFIKRAAEYGVNTSGALEMIKAAGLTSEFLGGAINPLGPVGTAAGAIAAALTPTRTDEEQLDAQDESFRNFLIPGRAAYNFFKRQGNMNKDDIIPVARDAGTAAAYGLMTGGLSHLGGGIAAALTPTKTEEELDEIDKDHLNSLIPGMGTYQIFKRLGASDKKFSKMLEEKKNKEK